MDSLSWDASKIVTNTTPMLWSTQQQGLEGEYYSMANTSSSIFLNHMQEMHKAQTHHHPPNCDGKVSDMVLHSANAANTSEIMMKSVMMMMPNTTSWEDQALTTSQSCMSLSTHHNYVPADFNNMAHQHHQQQQQLINSSLDCLLSATNSSNYTDTSAEDDGISMIFSDCRNLWNYFSSAAVSSAESDQSNNASKSNAMQQHQVSEIDETVSQSSSDKATDSNKVNSNCTKRSNLDPYFTISQNPSPASASASASVSVSEGGFKLISENIIIPPKSKKPRWEKRPAGSSNINFQQPNSSVSPSGNAIEEPDAEAMAQMKEMIYRAAAFRPVNLGVEAVEKPKRKNVRISSDPQTVAARQRRERISERIRVLQKIVPGGSKMDTASMLDEAANYLKFLRSQVKALESLGNKIGTMSSQYPSSTATTTSIAFSFNPYFPHPKP